MRSPRRGRTWGWPIALGVVSAAGLVSALVGDGGWDLASCFGLSLPVAVSAWHSLRPQPRD